MKKFAKATPWIKELFATAVDGLDHQPRQMFGYPCAFVNGQMFSGVFANSIVVRLPEDQRAKLLALGGSIFDPMGGRPMREYIQFSDEMLEDEETLREWVKRGFEYARTLPPKASKRAAKAKPAARSAASSVRPRRR